MCDKVRRRTRKHISLDATPSISMPPPHRQWPAGRKSMGIPQPEYAFGVAIILTFDLWPWKHFQQCPYSHHEYSYQVLLKSSSCYGVIVAREICVKGRTTAQRTTGHVRPTQCLLPPAVGGKSHKKIPKSCVFLTRRFYWHFRTNCRVECGITITWRYGPLIACRPSLFMLTLSVSFVPCMLSYSIFWSQTSNKLTYLLT